MIQKVCDKCKKIMGEGFDNELTFTEKRNTRYGFDRSLNLCPKCIKKFWEWMKK